MSDPIIVTAGGGQKELPKAGFVNAVCCYVEDVGWQDSPWGEKRQIIIGWELEERMKEGDSEGRRFLLSQTYTASLNERAKLYEHLSGWLGRKLTAKETKAYDISQLRGRPATLQIQHKESPTTGLIYANVTGVAPKMESAEDLEVELEKVPDWVAETKAKGATEGFTKPALGGDDETDIPF